MTFPIDNKSAVVLFDEFWNNKGKYDFPNNGSRTLENFKKRMALITDTEELDELVDESNSHKETMRKIAVQFYKYLRQEYKVEIESPLYGFRSYDYPFERQLEIAKYLHEPHTTKELVEHFHSDERTIRKDLEALRGGIEVLGTSIRIEEQKDGRKKYYKSTMHPIFLPLNLTEVFALTSYLPHILAHDDPNSKLLVDISNRIKAQLSDYAFQRLFPGEEIQKSKIPVCYTDDKKLAQSREGFITYLMKSGQLCEFFYNGERMRGKIRNDSETQQYMVYSEDDKPLGIKLEDADFIIDSFEYK